MTTTVNRACDRIEILSVSLLDTQRRIVEEMRQVCGELHRSLGWHYLLDLSWSAQQLDLIPGMRIIDAGAAKGVMQWWLAAQGADVLSVDRLDRTNMPRFFRAWCPVRGLRAGLDLRPLSRPGMKAFLPPRQLRHWLVWPFKAGVTLCDMFAKEPVPPEGRGTVTVYNQDLRSMPDIETDSIDAIVSISALEHNSPEELGAAVQELMRVLKPGGTLIATLGASKEYDWFHQPSQGWCYTEVTLQDIFQLGSDCPSNYADYDRLFALLRGCTELRNHLAAFYFMSGKNGMPWGRWDPKYQPVGIVKVKPVS